MTSKIAVLYSTIAALATIANLCAQALFTHFYQGKYAITASILFGTGLILPIKYLLDKKLIYKFKVTNLAHSTKVFLNYSIMGIFTTFIFWGIEFSFQIYFGTTIMRYIGGLIGLIMSFYIKYRLDKHFVFRY
ncbi:GtrA family protein [Polynucleobacter sp. P1-05-14]|uniref:GtrA family protein n=1 Tax=Polynucleobacter sp. P1-05-14 TaxID=1819732 RepID=UPI001C0DDE9E